MRQKEIEMSLQRVVLKVFKLTQGLHVLVKVLALVHLVFLSFPDSHFCDCVEKAEPGIRDK